MIDLTTEDGSKKSQATILIEIGEQAELFHDEKGDSFALVDGRQCYPIESQQFKEYLQREHFRLTGKGAGRNQVSDAVGTLSAKARFDGDEQPVYLRVGYVGGCLYIDLCDEEWRVVRIDGYSWEVLESSPVRFVRSNTARPLPEPIAGGSLELLRPFINVRDDRWPLVYGFLLGCFAPRGPYLHLALIGEQGTAKSTASRILRSLVDPSTVPLKQPPRDEEALMVTAMHNHLVVLDNLSGIKPEVSDGLCRLSTGGGLSKRRLFTDGDEFAVDIQRPAILNGIDDIATRPDLSERTITLELQPLRLVRNEREIWEELDALAPFIFGAICDALNAGLAYEDTVELKRRVRMADAATWIQGCEMATGLQEGTFLDAFVVNQMESVWISLENHPVTAAVMSMMDDANDGRFEGSATELLDWLSDRVDEDTRRQKIWPKSGDWLTKTLRRFGQSLRQVGIEFSQDRKSDKRIVRLEKSADSEKWRHTRHGVMKTATNDANDTNDAINHNLHALSHQTATAAAAAQFLK